VSPEQPACFVLNRGLRGVMFWEYTSDRTGKLLETMPRISP